MLHALSLIQTTHGATQAGIDHRAERRNSSLNSVAIAIHDSPARHLGAVYLVDVASLRSCGEAAGVPRPRSRGPDVLAEAARTGSLLRRGGDALRVLVREELGG